MDVVLRWRQFHFPSIIVVHTTHLSVPTDSKFKVITLEFPEQPTATNSMLTLHRLQTVSLFLLNYNLLPTPVSLIVLYGYFNILAVALKAIHLLVELCNNYVFMVNTCDYLLRE